MPTSSYENPESEIEDFFRIKSAGSSNYRGTAFFAFIKKSIANSKSERIALITRHPDNRYETRLTQPKRAAQPSNEIQSTKYYVRIYQRNMQNKPNFQKSEINAIPFNATDYENKSNWTLGENKPNSNPIFRKNEYKLLCQRVL